MRIVIFFIGLLFLGLSEPLTVREGQDYALFFAVNQYQYMDDLRNPVQNARDIAAELEQRYGFATEVVENPTLDDIHNKLEEYHRKFTNGTFAQKGQLFIYFSGHGVKQYNKGYFMTSNADPAQPQRGAMDYDFHRRLIDDIPCQHILVAIDACYSEAFDPDFANRGDRDYGRPGEEEFDRILDNHQQYRSRVFWTSGGEGDQTPDRSSFAYRLLEGLRSNTNQSSYLTSSMLFSQYMEKAIPQPSGGRFGRDETNASFLFFPKASPNIGDARADLVAYQQVLNENSIAACRQYLRDYPQGDFRAVVEQKLQSLEAEERELVAWQEAKTTNTLEAYRAFIREYPNGLYTDEVRRRIEGVQQAESWELIDWQKTLAANTIEAYQAFIDKYPSGLYAAEAQRRIEEAMQSFVFIEGSTYIMGCLDDTDLECDNRTSTAHRVSVSSFYLSKYEITQTEWRNVMGADPPQLHNTSCDQCPVEGVSWNDVQEFIQLLNAKTGQNYRLPTEAEWEYAARGGSQRQNHHYSGSNKVEEVAWCISNYRQGNPHGSKKTTRPVGSKQPNELGLYDMSGNVWEWCSDWYDSDYYKNSPQNNPQGPNKGTSRVARGGSWDDRSDSVSCTFRNHFNPDLRFHNVGFRLARSER